MDGRRWFGSHSQVTWQATMDLLREHYCSDSDGSSSSDDGPDEETCSITQTAQDVSEASAAASVSGSVESRTSTCSKGRHGKKRPRTSAAIDTALRQPQREKFARAVPHTPGNWAGHIFFPLAPTLTSSAAGSSVYDATNRAASRRLHIAARELIEDFATIVVERCHEQKDKESGGDDSLGNWEVVSHLTLLPVEQDDSSSGDDDESSSDDALDDDPGRCGRQSRDAGQGSRTETVPTTKANEANNGSNIPLHISISRPFYLQEQSISSFVEQVRKVLASYSPMAIALDVNNPEILVNDERTRSFLTIPAAQASLGDAPIVRMIRAIDPVMKRFGHSPYYEEAKVHTSIASISGDIRSLLAGTSYCGDRVDCSSGVSKPTQNITFMVDRIMLIFGATNEHCIFLEGR